MKINFHRVLLGFFENWDKSPQKKWDKGVMGGKLTQERRNMVKYTESNKEKKKERIRK